MGNKLENAKNLYLEGIKKGNLEAVDQYTGDRYTQHSTGVKDGVDGFKAFFKGFLERTNDRDIQVIRGIEDGKYVFAHVYQNIDNGAAKWITTDMFDTDENDKIIEHWDVIAPYHESEKTVSGNDMVLGEFELKDFEKTEENKSLIRCFLVEVYQNKNIDALGKYIEKGKLIQHSHQIDNGLDALKQHLSKGNIYYNFVFHVLGQGNHVVSMSKATIDEQAYCVFDIFRLEDGKIVEHWDNMEPIPEENVNGGKF